MKNDKQTKMAVLSSAADILQIDDIETREVPVPEWGGAVLVKGMSGIQRDRFEQSMMKGKGRNQEMNLENFRAKLVAASVVDDQGKLIFKPEHIAALGRKAVSALSRIVKVAQELSGLTDDDVEELTKNSESDLSGDSISN